VGNWRESRRSRLPPGKTGPEAEGTKPFFITCNVVRLESSRRVAVLTLPGTKPPFLTQIATPERPYYGYGPWPPNTQGVNLVSRMR